MSSIYKGIRVPDLTDPPNAPQQFRDLVDSGGAVPRFATLADANTAYPPAQRPAGLMVAVGTRLYISDGTNFVSVSAGGIESFPNRSARALAIPSPAKGQTTALDDWPGMVHTWDGARWMTEQHGFTYATTNAGGGAYVFFTKPFATAATSIVATGEATAGDSGISVVAAPLAIPLEFDRASIIFRAVTTGPSFMLANASVGFYWHVWGPS